MSRSAIRFLGSQAMLCLVGVLALAGLLVALLTIRLGPAHLRHDAYPDAAAEARMAACPPVLVSFTEELPLGKLEEVLRGFKARIVAGPDPHGAFALSVPSGQGQAVVDALNARPDLVIVASLREPCLPGH